VSAVRFLVTAMIVTEMAPPRRCERHDARWSAGSSTTRIEGGPASPVWPPPRIVAHEDDDRRVEMWTSENRMSTFPQRITYVELAFGGRFIEETESTETKRRRRAGSRRA